MSGSVSGSGCDSPGRLGKMWCIAELNAEYIARMEDVLALYEKPLLEKEPVVCMDEKPVVLHADVRPPRPMRPGRATRRHGETASISAAAQPTRSAALSPRRGGTLPKSRPTAPLPSSPIICWRSSLLIRRPTPFIW